MSFWEDASPVVKGALVVGVIGIIAAVYVGWFSDAGTDDGDTPTADTRGFQAGGGGGE